MAKRRKTAVELSLLKLTTDQFFISENLTSDDLKTEMTLDNSIFYGVDTTNSMAGCIFKFVMKKDDKELLVIETGAHFNFDDLIFNNLIDKKERTFTLPLKNATMMLMVAIGAARGVLYSKTEGTDINSIIIPLIDPESFLSDDIVLPLDKKKNEKK